MRKCLLLVLVLAAGAMLAKAAPPTSNPFEGPSTRPADSQIDKLVQARLSKLGLEPAAVCSDAVFLRRVYLEVIGALPTEKVVRDFLASKDADKRAELIDALLNREEFAQYWAMKWCDVLRVKAEFPINLWPNAAQAYHHWIWESLDKNKPYDKFVREMLTASGSNFRVPQVNFYRAMQSREPSGIAQTVALTFMGSRTDRWPKERLAGMASFFSQVSYKRTGEWKEEIVSFDIAKASTQPVSAASQPAVLPDGTKPKIASEQDPREVFADWLVSDKNPYFARAAVNRIWCWLMGRGIIHEADDIREDNPPINPELLAYLEKELVASHYDLKHIYRLILNSRTYQSSSIASSKKPEAAANFAYYPLRRLDAEVLIDALCQITGTTERYTSVIPEPFTFIPEAMRSVELPDGSISSAFLETFGRPSRDTGMESERNNRPTAAQRLYMLNSTHVQDKLQRGPKMQVLLRGKNQRDTITSFYLTILSRYPTDDEMKTAEEYIRKSPEKGWTPLIDIAWALVNSSEFMYRH